MTQEPKILLDVFRLEDKYILPASEIAWRAKDCISCQYEIWGQEQKERKQ